MPTLVFLRHGQSLWNLENRFTGWVDVPLTEEGEAQARKGGQLMKAQGIAFDHVYTSVLTRAIRTAWLALTEMGEVWLPLTKAWELNERHYGGLTGLNKAETMAKHGEEQVKVWRRSYDVPPPPISDDNPDNPAHDRRYAGIAVPRTESLKLTLERTLPYWEAEIAPRLKAGENLLIAAHGNSLRALIKHLFSVSEADIVGVEIPTGNPLVLELDAALKPVSASYADASRSNALPALP